MEEFYQNGIAEAGAFIWLSSMLFGAVVSATDPVAVVALLKDLGASKKLGTLIEGESLLNDGTAIVAFVLLIGVVTGAEVFTGTGDFIGTAAIGFGKIGAAGGLIGVFLGLIAILWVRKVFNDPMIEITVVLVTSYAVFFICEHFFHVSGVLGLVALGIVMAGIGRTRISPEVEHFMHEFWELVAFVANVIIFIRGRGCNCSKRQSDRNGFLDFGISLCGNSFGSGDQYGDILSPHEKDWLWIARERCNCGMVGSIAWCNWPRPCTSGIHGKFSL